MSSVFGSTRVPRLHNGTAEIALNDCVVTKDEPIFDIVEHISPLNGHVTTIVRGYWWVFEVRMNFWKQGTSTLMQNFLESVGDTNHRIKRFGDDDFVSENGSTDAYFTLVYIKPAFLTDARDKDVLIARWKSNTYVQIAETL